MKTFAGAVLAGVALAVPAHAGAAQYDGHLIGLESYSVDFATGKQNGKPKVLTYDWTLPGFQGGTPTTVSPALGENAVGARIRRGRFSFVTTALPPGGYCTYLRLFKGRIRGDTASGVIRYNRTPCGEGTTETGQLGWEAERVP